MTQSSFYPKDIMVRHICLWILLIHLLSDEVDDQERIRNMKLMVARIPR
jgi:hypothetical protein